MIYILLPHVPAEPIGGVQTLFDYAERLNELAQTTVAKVVCPATYVRSILPRSYSTVPVLHKRPTVEKNDVLVFAETLITDIDFYPTNVKKYIAVLNWQYFEMVTRRSDQFLAGVAGILTNSTFTANKISERYPSLKVTHIPHVIESRFKASTPFHKRDEYSVLIMNRKNTHHIPAVLSFLEQSPHKVTIVNNIDSEKLISLYNQHQIFVNLGYPEGFCRPAAEAMACGAVVVGFTGGGGNDFMKHGYNSFIAPDGDEQSLIELLSFAMHKLGKEDLADVSLNARDTIARTYTPVMQAKSLFKVFKKEIGKTYTQNDIEKLYKYTVKKQLNKTYKPLFTTVTSDTLELQLFNERRKYREITSSKFFALWQGYVALKDRLLHWAR